MYLVNAQQMRDIDRFAMEEIGIPGIVLMEAAGIQVANEVIKRWPKCRSILVLAGHGNNGGDAFVAARHLANKGYQVNTWLVGKKERMTQDCSTSFHAYINSKLSFQELNEGNWEQLLSLVSHADLVMDGLLGTGVNRPVQGMLADLIDQVNQKRVGQVLAIDIPSGIHADTGEILDHAIKADLTVTFAFPKWGHYLFPGASCCGEVLVRDISIPNWVTETFSLSNQVLQREQVASLLPKRPRHSHKGTYGHVLIIGGSANYVGAPVMSSMAALRSGSGLVTLAVPNSIYPFVASKVTEAIFWALPEEHGALSKESWKKIAERKGQYDFTVIGPGISTAPGVEWLKKLVENTQGPLLIDADGLNLLAKDLTILKGRNQIVLTPHPGEMARLMGCTVAEVEKNRPNVAREFAVQHQVYLVLKGTYPIIATPEGKLFISSRGSSSMAKGGSGDVLAGMIGALANQTKSVEKGILLAVYLHGMSGEFMDEYSGLATDLTLLIGRAFRELAGVN